MISSKGYLATAHYSNRKDDGEFRLKATYGKRFNGTSGLHDIVIALFEDFID